MTRASRWADEEADAAEAAQRKKEKEAKKRLKLAKQQVEEAEEAEEVDEVAIIAAVTGAAAAVAAAAVVISRRQAQAQESDSHRFKRRRLSGSVEGNDEPDPKPEERKLLRFEAGGWGPARHTSNFEILNAIEEGSYGWVSRARDTATSEIVALKKVKMDHLQDGFPITALREIHILQKARHKNIVELKETIMGNDLSEVVLVMEFLEHDLKTLQEDMAEPFLASEVKTLLRQLGGAVDFLHENFIMHRDLKTSNILINNRGILKIADFGMARMIPPPHAPLTQLVVTLWYRAPELLLGAHTYDTSVDMWSLGCIFGELLLKEPLLPGKNEVDSLTLIFTLCGLPTEKKWPAFYRLPNAKSLKMPRESRNTGSIIRAKFPFLTNAGAELLSSLLSLNPEGRPSAKEMLAHPYFAENPRPKPPDMFPTFPSKAGQEKRRVREPLAPKRGEAPGIQQIDFSGIFANRDEEEKGAGFTLRMA